MEDTNRELTPQGLADVARVIEQAPITPGEIDHILHSGVARTEQTANIVAEAKRVSKITSAPLWLAESQRPDLCLTMLEGCDENTLLVSHQPFLTPLLHELLMHDLPAVIGVQFSTAMLVCLEKVDDLWQLQWIVSPQDL